MLHRIFVFAICCPFASISGGMGYAAISISVGDSSFELVAVEPSSIVIDGPGNWARAWGGGFADRSFETIPPLYPSQDGSYLGNIFVTGDGNFAALYQDVVRIEAGTYTFNVGVAHEPGAEPTVAPFLINFEAVGFGSGTVLLEENLYNVGVANSSDLTNITATLTIPLGHPEIGRTLRPVLLTVGADAGSNPDDPRGSYMMDNVSMSFAPISGPERTIRVGSPSFDPSVWNTPFGSGDNATFHRPEMQLYPSQVGDQLAALIIRNEGGWGAALWQDTIPIEEGVYELTVAVAHDLDFAPTTSPFQINFESVAPNGAVTLLGENIFPVGAVNSSDLTDVTATLVIPSGMPNIGETLRLVLLATGNDAGSSSGADDPRAIYYLDNVRLEFESATGPGLVADFNNDGFVDGEDLLIWQSAYGINDDADANGDGISDGRDFLIWQRHFGSGVRMASAITVPEPMAITVVFLGMILGATARHRRIG